MSRFEQNCIFSSSILYFWIWICLACFVSISHLCAISSPQCAPIGSAELFNTILVVWPAHNSLIVIFASPTRTLFGFAQAIPFHQFTYIRVCTCLCMFYSPFCLPAHIMSHSSSLNLCYPVQASPQLSKKTPSCPNSGIKTFRTNSTAGCQSVDHSSLYFPPSHTLLHTHLSI